MDCPVCKHPKATIQRTNRDGKEISCPRCGKFFISGTAETILDLGEYEDDRWKISAWIRQHSVTDFLSDDLDRAVEAIPPSIGVRAERVLRWLYENSSEFGHQFRYRPAPITASKNDLESGRRLKYQRSPPESPSELACLQAIGWCKNQIELERMIDEYLVKKGWLNKINNRHIMVSAEGIEHLESSKSQTDSRIGFCAMWFGNEVKSAWTDAIEPGIRAAGWEPLRVDGIEHAGKIDDQIVKSIRQSRFVVADFTGHRGGVYFEAGLAQGLGIPVIWTCREGDMDHLHFDIRQYNCIAWTADRLDEFCNRVRTRIEAVIGRGPMPVQR